MKVLPQQGPLSFEEQCNGADLANRAKNHSFKMFHLSLFAFLYSEILFIWSFHDNLSSWCVVSYLNQQQLVIHKHS